MVVLGIDYGEKRIGLAKANTEVKFASPLLTLANDPSFTDKLTEVIAEQGAQKLIVGLPHGLDGQETAQTALARQFGHKLAKHTGLQIAWQDEAGTSLEAKKQLSKAKNASIDSLAATLILQDYLDNL